MHLAYSALNTTTNKQQPTSANHEQAGNNLLLRFQAYQTTCTKYSREIAAIQKYIPGWTPKFR